MASRLNNWNGIRGASVGAICGAAAPLVLVILLAVARGVGIETSRLGRPEDLLDFPVLIIWPSLGSAAVCGAAGWATYAPAGKYRFVTSLALVSLFSASLWILIFWMDVTPMRIKFMEHPVPFPSEVLLIVGPAVFAAALVTVLRVRGK